MMKFSVLARNIVNNFVALKCKLFSDDTKTLQQYQAGGEDYNPPEGAEGIAGFINDNPADGFVIAWRDKIAKITAPGEKRIYSVADGEIQAEIHLKNTGEIAIKGNSVLNITVNGACTLQATNTTIKGGIVNLGEGGQPIARLGDAVQVDPVTHSGVITSAGTNTSV